MICSVALSSQDNDIFNFKKHPGITCQGHPSLYYTVHYCILYLYFKHLHRRFSDLLQKNIQNSFFRLVMMTVGRGTFSGRTGTSYLLNKYYVRRKKTYLLWMKDLTNVSKCIILMYFSLLKRHLSFYCIFQMLPFRGFTMVDLSNVSISFTTAIVYVFSGVFFFLLIFLLIMLGISDCHFFNR